MLTSLCNKEEISWFLGLENYMVIVILSLLMSVSIKVRHVLACWGQQGTKVTPINRKSLDNIVEGGYFTERKITGPEVSIRVGLTALKTILGNNNIKLV